MPESPTYDPLDAATLEDPHPALAVLREHSPVFWHEGMASWVVTRYDDCVAVLRNHTGFARDRRRAGVAVPSESLSVQTLDPPDQAPVRSLFMNSLRAADLDGIQRRAHTLLAERFAALGDREFDLMTEVAAPLAVSVISDLLGVAEPDVASFAAISNAIMRSMDGGLDPSVVEPGRRAREQLSDLVDSWFRSSTRAGVLPHVRAHAPANADTELYVRNTARVLFQGGYSTTVAALGNTMHLLLTRPDLMAALRADPGLVDVGVDELMRFDGPVQGTSRIAMRSCRIGDVDVAAGQTVTVLFAAANRDPARFSQPDRVVLGRSPNPHLGFGWGAHACLGTAPAQVALRVLVSGLLSQPAPPVPRGVPVRCRTATMRVFAGLPAAFSASDL